LASERQLEEKIRKIEFENPKAVDKKKNDQERDHIHKIKLQVVEHAKSNIENPHHLLDFLKDLYSKNQYPILLLLAPTTFFRTESLENFRQKQELLEVHIKVLEEEKQNLKNR